jgi:hypothetical protein
VEIQINNQNLDFSIESNETLGDVVKGIEAWLEGTDLVLYSVKHGEQELLSLPSEQWAQTPHGEVGTLNVMVKHTRELTLLNLQTILEYLGMLKQGISAGGDRQNGQLKELLAGFPALVESLRKHFPDSESILQTLVTLFGDTEADQVLSWGEEKKAQTCNLIDLISTQVSFRLQELQDPKAALRTLSGALKVCIEEISEISILLQTGKDRQAMDTMVRFSELSQSLVRVVASVFSGNHSQVDVGGMSLRDFYAELNSILAELLEAFEAKDSVLIGDLMEYEIAPRLQQLRSFLQEVT